MSLTFSGIKNAKPRAKPYRLSDGGSLYFLVQPNGNKFWRFRYRFAGVEKMLALGTYPATSLAEARAKRDEAKEQLESGKDPSIQRKREKAAVTAAMQNTFGAIAAEFVDNMKKNEAAASTLDKAKWLLEDVAAPLTRRAVTDITSAELLALLKHVERSGRRETARRLRSRISAVFRLAIVTLRATNDPTLALKGALLNPKVTHRAAIIDEAKFGGLLRCIDAFDGWPTLKAAMLFTALTCARPGEVRFATRVEINFEKALWRIPAERTKMRRQHDVPLSRQALDVLKDVWLFSEQAELVFPSLISAKKPLSENAVNSALRRMGYAQDEMTSHGFRATASTILNERGVNADVIEAVLGHQHQNAIRRTYNRASYWPERVALMQKWADMLDEFRNLPAT